jgi:putative addiction module component (TIGR02574 family)
MSSAQIRQRLHDYIDIAEDKKLKAIYTLLQDDIDDGYQLTEEQKAELDRRLHDYNNGLGRTYSWDETVAIIDQALLNRKNGK